MVLRSGARRGGRVISMDYECLILTELSTAFFKDGINKPEVKLCCTFVSIRVHGIIILNCTEELIVLGDRDRGALRPSLRAPHIDTPANLHILGLEEPVMLPVTYGDLR